MGTSQNRSGKFLMKFMGYLTAAMFASGIFQSVHATSDIDDLVSQAQKQTEAGNLPRARSLLEQAVITEPSSSLVHTRMGGVLLLLQKYTASIEHFQQAIMLEQQNSEAFIGLAIAYLHLGRYQVAREALQQAQQIDPSKRKEIDQVLAWMKQRSSDNHGH